MEEDNTVVGDEGRQPIYKKNKMAVMGIGTALLGVIILLITSFVYGQISGYIPESLALLIRGISFGLPVIGLVISILCVSKWRKEISFEFKIIAIVTIVLCNPMFLFIYYLFCVISTMTFAGLNWM